MSKVCFQTYSLHTQLTSIIHLNSLDKSYTAMNLWIDKQKTLIKILKKYKISPTDTRPSD